MNRKWQSLLGGLLAVGVVSAYGQTGNNQTGVNATKAIAAATVSDLSQKLLATGQLKSDDLFKDLSLNLASSVSSLGQSLAGNKVVQAQLDTAVQALLGNKDISALEAYQKLATAKLTPEQLKLVSDTKNVFSAFMVQKNFATLPNSQSEVAQVVKALREGNAATAVPALQKLSANTQLTAPQKQLLSSVADQYAPGLKKAGKALQDGAKTLDLFKK